MTCSSHNFPINAYISKKCSTFLCVDNYCIIHMNRFISQSFISAKNIIRKMYIGILRIYYKKFNSLIYQFAYQANMVRMVVRCQNISNFNLICIDNSLSNTDSLSSLIPSFYHNYTYNPTSFH